jgi:hypothetical protein
MERSELGRLPMSLDWAAMFDVKLLGALRCWVSLQSLAHGVFRIHQEAFTLWESVEVVNGM